MKYIGIKCNGSYHNFAKHLSLSHKNEACDRKKYYMKNTYSLIGEYDFNFIWLQTRHFCMEERLNLPHNTNDSILLPRVYTFSSQRIIFVIIFFYFYLLYCLQIHYHRKSDAKIYFYLKRYTKFLCNVRNTTFLQCTKIRWHNFLPRILPNYGRIQSSCLLAKVSPNIKVKGMGCRFDASFLLLCPPL